MVICQHCNSVIKHRLSDHYKSCSSYKSFITQCKEKCSKEFLLQEYVINNKSMAIIARELGLSKTRLVLDQLILHDIPIKSLQEALKSPTRQELTRKKAREKYGLDHHLSAPSVISKRNQSNKEKYGFEVVSQVPSIREKIKSTNLEKYGTSCVLASPKIVQKIHTNNLIKFGSINPWGNPNVNKKCTKTKLEKGTALPYYSKSSQVLFWKIYTLLPKELQEKCYFAELNKEFVKFSDQPYVFDFVISSINYCLEYNGNYYHANPKIYSEEWINTKLNLTAKEIWQRDKTKQDIIKNLGFHLDIVWEDEDMDSAVTRIVESILNHSKNSHK